MSTKTKSMTQKPRATAAVPAPPAELEDVATTEEKKEMPQATPEEIAAALAAMSGEGQVAHDPVLPAGYLKVENVLIRWSEKKVPGAAKKKADPSGKLSDGGKLRVHFYYKFDPADFVGTEYEEVMKEYQAREVPLHIEFPPFNFVKVCPPNEQYPKSCHTLIVSLEPTQASNKAAHEFLLALQDKVRAYLFENSPKWGFCPPMMDIANFKAFQCKDFYLSPKPESNFTSYSVLAKIYGDMEIYRDDGKFLGKGHVMLNALSEKSSGCIATLKFGPTIYANAKYCSSFQVRQVMLSQKETRSIKTGGTLKRARDACAVTPAVEAAQREEKRARLEQEAAEAQANGTATNEDGNGDVDMGENEPEDGENEEAAVAEEEEGDEEEEASEEQ